MFEQYVADGANTFIIIVAIIIGFVAALGFVDQKNPSKKQEKRD